MKCRYLMVSLLENLIPQKSEVGQNSAVDRIRVKIVIFPLVFDRFQQMKTQKLRKIV